MDHSHEIWPPQTFSNQSKRVRHSILLPLLQQLQAFKRALLVIALLGKCLQLSIVTIQTTRSPEWETSRKQDKYQRMVSDKMLTQPTGHSALDKHWKKEKKIWMLHCPLCPPRGKRAILWKHLAEHNGRHPAIIHHFATEYWFQHYVPEQ